MKVGWESDPPSRKGGDWLRFGHFLKNGVAVRLDLRPALKKPGTKFILDVILDAPWAVFKGPEGEDSVAFGFSKRNIPLVSKRVKDAKAEAETKFPAILFAAFADAEKIVKGLFPSGNGSGKGSFHVRENT